LVGLLTNKANFVGEDTNGSEKNVNAVNICEKNIKLED
jgi:hypothetical protein